MTLPALPAALKYGQVTGRFLMAVIDGVDEDGNPDARVVTGTITFTPSAPVLLVQTGAAPAQVFLEPITATIDTTGVIRDRQGRAGIMLVATDSPDVNPTSWTWTAHFELSGGIRREPIAFHLPGDGTVDLAVVAPVRASDGTFITRGPQGPPGNTGIDWDEIFNKPQFAPTATSSSYYALTDRPTLVTRPDLHDASGDASMTALEAKKGDRVRRTDQNRMYQLRVEPASNLANWIAELNPAEADVTAATSAPTPSVLVRRDASGSAEFARVRTSGHEIVQIAAPNSPPTGSVVWYLDSADGHLRYRDAAGTIRRPASDWGSGTTLPASGMLRGDVYRHTGLNTLLVYTGNNWRQAHRTVVADVAARNALSTTYAALLHTGYEVYVEADKTVNVWDGSAWAAQLSSGGDATYLLATGVTQTVPSAANLRLALANAAVTTPDVTQAGDAASWTLNRAGVWLLSGGYRVVAQGTGGVRFTLALASGDGATPFRQTDAPNIANHPTDLAISAPFRFPAGQSVSVVAFTNGASVNLDSAAGAVSRTFFSAVYLRP